jgi:hypothetical protein
MEAAPLAQQESDKEIMHRCQARMGKGMNGALGRDRC